MSTETASEEQKDLWVTVAEWDDLIDSTSLEKLAEWAAPLIVGLHAAKWLLAEARWQRDTLAWQTAQSLPLVNHPTDWRWLLGRHGTRVVRWATREGSDIDRERL